MIEGSAPDRGRAVASLSIDDLKTEAVTLKIAIDQGEQRTREWRIRLGEVLAEIRTRVGHGNWLPYVAEHLPIEQAQAKNYMQLATNRQRVSDLPADLSMREELAALRKPLEPKPLDEVAVVEAEPEPLLRANIDRDSADIIADILRVCFPDAATALDATYGSGAFWNGTAHVAVTAVDLDPSRALHGVADFRRLRYAEGSFDVVILDPPHLSDSGDESVMGERFGTYPAAEMGNTIALGVREAWRVGRLGVVVKVTDHTHGAVYVAESDWVRAALDGLPPYEVVYQVRSHAFVDPKWGRPQLSAYNNLSTYLIFRHGDQRHRR